MSRFLFVLMWSGGYLHFSKVFIKSQWNFEVFNPDHWKMLYENWSKINNMNDYLFLGCIILWIPILLIGIYFILHFLGNSKRSIVRLATASHPFIPAYTPSQMPSQGKSVQLESTSIPVVQTQAMTSQFNVNEMQVTPSAKTETKMDYVPKHQGEADALEKIETLAQEFGLTAFPHVLLENQLIPITISNDSDAFLIKVLADPGIWQANITEPLESAIWTNGTINKTALKEIVLGKNILMKMEPDSVVTPVLVLAQGTLANANTIVPWFNQHGIEIVTLSDNKQLDILTLDDIIIKYFPQEENQEEENENAQASIV